MKILAIDSSGLTASAAVVEEDRVLAELNVNNKKNHSTTLLPMIDMLQRLLELDMDTLDAIAVSKGPGSFTGLRIGSATAKGLALALDKPIVEISTLEAMAYQIACTEKYICPMLDARRSQVYTGVYRYEDGGFKTVVSDRAEAVEETIGRLNEIAGEVVLLGDGVPVYKDIIEKELKAPHEFAPAFQNRQRAAALGILAIEYARLGRTIPSDMHAPNYLRLSQAERERLERSNV